MPLPVRHSIDTNYKKGGSLGVIEQLDLTTSYPQTVAVLDGLGNQITDFTGLSTLPTVGNNPSYTITRNVSGYITSIAQVIGVTTYTKTITRDGSNYITGISVWV